MFCCFTTTNLLAQYISLESGNVKSISKIPKEKVFVRLNTSFLFVGEYLYYSFYCLDTNSNLPSIVSKIGYVELIDNEGNVIVKQKLRLKNGKSSSDFFIPVSVPSGNYKIVGYTKWMLNWNSFFSSGVNIMNPYQDNQEAIFNGSKIPEVKNSKIDINPLADNISLDDISYKKRSKITMNIKNKAKLLSGSFSLSVRKINPIKPNTYSTNTSSILNEGSEEDRPELKNDSIILPEARGEVISGKIFSNKDSLRVSNVKIALSFPDNKENFIKISNTDVNGFFYFNIGDEYTSEADAIFQVVDENKEFYKIKLDEHPSLDYKNLKFNDFRIASTPKIEELIVERSIHNQIENSYFKVKPDSIIEKKPSFLFEDTNMLTYDLDDYARFKTIRETLVEIVDHVWTEKKNGESVFRIREVNADYSNSLNIGNSDPMVIVDGVLIQDHNSVLNFDARKVKNISVIRDRYVYGNGIYQGVIIIQTQELDYISQNRGEYQIQMKLQSPEARKNYFKQNYVNDHNEFISHVPDFRYQLLWEPNVAINDSENKQFVFYTSDVAGVFNISLVGFTLDGSPISINKSFIVK